MKKIIFFANYNVINDPSGGLSGGDRIWIELLRRWKTKFETLLLGSEDSVNLARFHKIEGITTLVTAGKAGANPLSLLETLKHITFRTGLGIKALITYRKLLISSDYVYSVSDFYPDFLPAFLLKLANPRIQWIAGYYLFASAPFSKFSPYKGKNRMKGLVYWLGQKLSFIIVRTFADFIFVTSVPDADRFTRDAEKDLRLVVVRGGVDTGQSESYLNSGRVLPLAQRVYDACFLGRFHVQKGVLELLQIWSLVVMRKPGARLVLIGNGQLEEEARRTIRELGLEINVDLLGFLDGQPKFEIFKQSKVVVHPATYDSGGMAAAEAMAWGLPGVSFDLDSLKTYYPQGMLKTACFDLQQFADNILRLLEDNKLYERLSRQARDLIVREWDWDKRAAVILKRIVEAGVNE